MPMRGLTILITNPDPNRFRTALTMAAAAAALGAPTRVYLHEGAVTLLSAQDMRVPAGLPMLGELRAIAIDSGVALIACQTGLALAGLSADAAGVEAGGMIDLLATLSDDRLVTL
ncbi:DsrE family protein [Sphingomonas sp. 2R-10]|uniref:DsrE family protein n=1 Tax=Sphingomonas sp. 2R-10 TaxID=3045148 RepID=UPI000F7924E5|nr:DsrE family protein [Sphingomonas sp. 2R-10]MDJ0275631.1 DsrE family protein [Sphingomonas sp. 2R-10]